MKFLLTTGKLLDAINDWIGRVLCWLIVPLVLLTVMEVILRRFFGAPTIWSFEVLKQIYAVHFMTVAGYGLLHNSHVSVDIFTQMLGSKKKAAIEILGYLVFFFPFCIICAWQGFIFAKTSWKMLEHTWSVFAPPLYPIKTIILITFILLILQGTCEVIKRVFILKGWKYD